MYQVLVWTPQGLFKKEERNDFASATTTAILWTRMQEANEIEVVQLSESSDVSDSLVARYVRCTVNGICYNLLNDDEKARYDVVMAEHEATEDVSIPEIPMVCPQCGGCAREWRHDDICPGHEAPLTAEDMDNSHPIGCQCAYCINANENAVDLARMLEDLDGIVIDEEVGIFAPDVPAWLLSDDTLQQIREEEEIPF